MKILLRKVRKLLMSRYIKILKTLHKLFSKSRNIFRQFRVNKRAYRQGLAFEELAKSYVYNMLLCYISRFKTNNVIFIDGEYPKTRYVKMW